MHPSLLGMSNGLSSEALLEFSSCLTAPWTEKSLAVTLSFLELCNDSYCVHTQRSHMRQLASAEQRLALRIDANSLRSVLF